MSLLTSEDIVLSHLAFAVRAFHDMYLITLKLKRSKPKKQFSLPFYVKDNVVKWIMNYLAVWMFLFAVPELMDMFEYGHKWSPLIAIGIGFSTLELIHLAEKRFKNKLEKAAE